MRNTWLKVLKKEIKDAQRICIMGIGNTKRGDDAVGPLSTLMIMFKMRRRKFKDLIFVNGGETPENFSNDIRRFQPTLTLIIDACKSGKKPGSVYIVNPVKIQFNDISTHRLPLSMFVKFLEQTIPTKVIILGIEPKNLNFGDDISIEVEKSIDGVVLSLVELLNAWQEMVFARKG